MCRGLFRVVQNQVPKDAHPIETRLAGDGTLDLEVLFTSARCRPVEVGQDPPLWPSPRIFCHPDAGGAPEQKLAQAAACVAETLRGIATGQTPAPVSVYVASQLCHLLEEALAFHDAALPAGPDAEDIQP